MAKIVYLAWLHAETYVAQIPVIVCSQVRTELALSIQNPGADLRVVLRVKGLELRRIDSV